MSTAPICEALKRLEQEGVVTVLPHRGIRVNKLSSGQIREAYIVREGLEIQAARIVAGEANKGILAHLRLTTEKIEELAGEGKYQEAAYADYEWHLEMVRSARCEMLTERFEQLSTVCLLSEGQWAPTGDVEEWTHSDLVEALESGDPEQAEKLIRHHIASYASKVGMNRPKK